MLHGGFISDSDTGTSPAKRRRMVKQVGTRKWLSCPSSNVAGVRLKEGKSEGGLGRVGSGKERL